MAQLGFVEEDFRKVHFIPFVPYEELPKLYNLAEMSVMPAYYDGCSTTMMESMACGCPVVASKSAAGPEIGGEGALYADPQDPADFADKIRSVANNSLLRADMKRRTLVRAEYFNWRRTAQATLDGLVRATGGTCAESADI
jgi:glycosyltransferase involved in cell wall biosynthesis